MRMRMLAAVSITAAITIGVLAWAAQQRVLKAQKGARTIVTTKVTVPPGREVATLAGGCFWCTEAIFKDVKGVEAIQPGYAGGHVANPTYKQVCTGQTGHAEAIQFFYDPKVVSYRDLLRVFLTTHDPTTLNRQGADVGTQYRSDIFTHSDAQAADARAVIAEITREKLYRDPIVTEVTPFTSFYPAEEYHRDYFARNPNQGYCTVVIAPKVAKFREKYRDMLRK